MGQPFTLVFTLLELATLFLGSNNTEFDST